MPAMSIPDPVSLDNLLSLHGRCAVVTGGSRGLGEAIKSLATIDRMSGGRLIAGIGVGWNEAEFAALGVPFHERGARTDKYLRLWQACWAPGKVSFAGRFFSFSDMHVNPKAGAGAASADLDRRRQRCGTGPSSKSMECFIEDVAPIVSGERIGSKN